MSEKLLFFLYPGLDISIHLDLDIIFAHFMVDHFSTLFLLYRLRFMQVRGGVGWWWLAHGSDHRSTDTG